MIQFNSLPSTRLSVTSPFGPRRHPVTGLQTFHHGIDIRPAIAIDQIRSVMDGKVSQVYFNTARGNVIVIDHGNRIMTLYQHLRERSPLSVGSSVKAGAVIGIMGNSGTSTGVHLHMELLKNGTPTDPMPYLEEYVEYDTMRKELKTQFDELMNNWLIEQGKQPESGWSVTEGHWKTATYKRITDGTRPRSIATRQEVIAWLGRLGLL